MMRVTFLMARNEIVQIIRIRIVLMMLLVLPLLLIFLLGNALDSEIKPVRLSLYIGDKGDIGHAAEQYLTSSSVKPYIHPQFKDSDAEVQADLVQGRADFGFSIADDFSGLVGSGQGEVYYYPGKYEDRNMAAESTLNGWLQEIRINQAAARVVPSSSQVALNELPVTGAHDERVRTGTL